MRRALKAPRRALHTTICTSLACTAYHCARRSASAAESDFVGIDMLPGCGSGTPGTNMLSTSGSLAGMGPTLGVVRSPEEPENRAYSRFRIPLKEPSQGAGVYRLNSRACIHNEEGHQTPHEHTSSASEPPQDDRCGDQYPDGPSSPTSASAKCLSNHVPPSASLPYDDDKFAEMLLQMEVEGAIDECWQDARKAHIEDVKAIRDILASLKVRDICCVDVSSKTSSFDYIMFGTCEGCRHIHLAAWAAQEADTLHRISKIRRKQTDELWEVVPVGRIVVNLMVESLRDELTLERKWAVTSSMDPLTTANAPISEGRQARAHGLWTLTLNLQDLEDFEVDYCKEMLMRQH